MHEEASRQGIWVSVLFCCLLLLTGTHALAAAVPSAIDASTAPSGANLPFYEARKGDLTIFVLGTLHVGRPDDYPFRKAITDALQSSGTVAFELSPDDLTMSQEDVQRYGMCARACLPRMVPATMWRKIAHRLRGNRPMLNEIKHMRPWLASLLIETVDSMGADLQTEYGTENQIENIYRGRIVGLESLSEQMEAFTGLNHAQQLELLGQELAQTPARSTAQVEELHRLWRAGDAETIYDWSQSKAVNIRQSPLLADQVDERILYARNRRFVARMLFIADPGKPVFVAIGALHLGGPRGVLSLLRMHGFIVTQR